MNNLGARPMQWDVGQGGGVFPKECAHKMFVASVARERREVNRPVERAVRAYGREKCTAPETRPRT